MIVKMYKSKIGLFGCVEDEVLYNINPKFKLPKKRKEKKCLKKKTMKTEKNLWRKRLKTGVESLRAMTMKISTLTMRRWNLLREDGEGDEK